MFEGPGGGGGDDPKRRPEKLKHRTRTFVELPFKCVPFGSTTFQLSNFLEPNSPTLQLSTFWGLTVQLSNFLGPNFTMHLKLVRI